MDNNVVDIEYAANVTVKLTNTVITWIDNSGNERVDETHKVLLDKNGNPTFKYVTKKYPNYSLENLEYNVLKDTSQNPVDAVQYSKVLLKVFRHYIDAKDTYKDSMRYRYLMLKLQREICRINSDIKEEDLQMDF